MNSAKVYHMKAVLQKHQDPLDLGSLPQVAPLRDDWPAIESALRRDHMQRSVRRRTLFGLAAAASLTLALAVVLSARNTELLPAGPATAQPEELPTPSAATTAMARRARLDSLIQRSQGLESRLRIFRFEAGSLPAQTVVYQAELEDLVVQIDEQLSLQPDSLQLWSQRVALLRDLEQLYEQGLRREYARMASL